MKFPVFSLTWKMFHLQKCSLDHGNSETKLLKKMATYEFVKIKQYTRSNQKLATFSQTPIKKKKKLFLWVDFSTVFLGTVML